MATEKTETSTSSFDSFESDLQNLVNDDFEASDDGDSDLPMGNSKQQSINQQTEEMKNKNDKNSQNLETPNLNPIPPKSPSSTKSPEKTNSTSPSPCKQKKVTISSQIRTTLDNSSTFALTSAPNAHAEDEQKAVKPPESPERSKSAPRRQIHSNDPKPHEPNSTNNSVNQSKDTSSSDEPPTNYVDSHTQYDLAMHSSNSFQSIPSDASDNYQKSNQNEYTQAELEEGVQMLQHKRFPDPAMSAPLNNYLESKMKDCVMNGDYDKANSYQNLQQFLESYVDYEPQMKSRELQENRNLTKLEQAKQNYKNLERRYQVIIKNATAENMQREQNLLEEQEREIEAFEQHWKQPEILYPFTKPSPQLLYLRQTETHFALAKSFDRAKMIKQQADRLQRQETREARERAKRSMKMAYSKIEARHQRELECLRTRSETIIRTIESERDKKLAVSRQVIERLENAGVYVKQPTKRSFRVKPIQDDANMKSKQWSLNLGPISIRSVIRKKKAQQYDYQD